jgi:hypothetical protein
MSPDVKTPEPLDLPASLRVMATAGGKGEISMLAELAKNMAKILREAQQIAVLTRTLKEEKTLAVARAYWLEKQLARERARPLASTSQQLAAVALAFASGVLAAGLQF